MRLFRIRRKINPESSGRNQEEGGTTQDQTEDHQAVPRPAGDVHQQGCCEEPGPKRRRDRVRLRAGEEEDGVRCGEVRIVL